MRNGVHSGARERGGRHTRAARRSPPPHYRGRRRAGGGAAPPGTRRLVLVALTVGAVLAGTGALARTLPDLPGLPLLPVALPEPVRLPQPAPAPSAQEPGVPGSPTPPAPTPPGRSAAPTATPGTGPPATTAAPSPVPTGSPTPVPTGSPVPPTDSYEAEAAELSGFVSIFPVPDASGGEVVGMIGRQADNHVRFVAVTVPAAGEYAVTFHYVSAPPGEAEVAVNGGAAATVDFPGLGDTHTVGTVTVPLQLAAGANEIWYGRRQGPAPALDRITLDH